MSIALTEITLTKGRHQTPFDGMNLIEACAYIAGESFTDHPKCVSRLLAETGRQLNDLLPADERQNLKPLIPYLIRTIGDGFDLERPGLAWSWVVGVYVPTWLRLAGLENHAATLEIANPDDALPPLIAAREAIENATWDVSWDVAWEAAWSAARSAARNAARSAARNTAWGAAHSASRNAAWHTAWSVAWDVAEGAVWYAAAHSTASALQLTSDALRASFTQVYFAMVMLGQETEPTL